MMNSTTLSGDLEHSRQRLQYYTELKGKAGYEKSESVLKWIEIYSERVAKLERQVAKLGLKTQIPAAATKAAPAKTSSRNRRRSASA